MSAILDTPDPFGQLCCQLDCRYSYSRPCSQNCNSSHRHYCVAHFPHSLETACSQPLYEDRVWVSRETLLRIFPDERYPSRGLLKAWDRRLHTCRHKKRGNFELWEHKKSNQNWHESHRAPNW